MEGNTLLEKVDRVAEVSVSMDHVNNEMAFHTSHPNIRIEAKKVVHTPIESNARDQVHLLFFRV